MIFFHYLLFVSYAFIPIIKKKGNFFLLQKIIFLILPFLVICGEEKKKGRARFDFFFISFVRVFSITPRGEREREEKGRREREEEMVCVEGECMCVCELVNCGVIIRGMYRFST